MALLLPTGGFNAKHYILAALTATLVSAVIVTVGFVVLGPAHIHFSVVSADYRRVSGDRGVAVHLSLALSANNPSRRAMVLYLSMHVEVSNSTWSTNFLPANVTTPMPLRQPMRSVTTIDASLTLPAEAWTEAFPGNMTSDLVVTVTALARFKIGAVRTRLYDIEVSCGPIDFFSAPGHRQSQSSTTGLPPVDCKITS